MDAVGSRAAVRPGHDVGRGRSEEPTAGPSGGRSPTAPAGAVIRATFELEPAGSAEALVTEVSLGRAEGPAFVAGRVVAEDHGRATVELPAANWSPDLTMLLTALAGEVLETVAFGRCRLAATVRAVQELTRP